MHPNRAFHWDDPAAIKAFVADTAFGQLFATTPDGPRVAHIPVVWQDDTHLRFHLARGNALTRHLDGATGLFVVNGPDAYISPDWYGLDQQVPTWNYVAAELQGPLRRLSDTELVDQVEALSARHEARLAPKQPWTAGKLDAEIYRKLLGAIAGFEMRVEQWRGTRKLGQNKSIEMRMRVADTLEASGSAAMAALMRAADTEPA